MSLVWLVLAVLTTAPYLVAELRVPKGHIFSGVLTAYDDTFTYFAWMRQGADGHLLMCDLFTSEPQSCEFLLPLWSALGFVSRLTGISIPLTFHAARLLAALVLLAVARIVASTVTKSRTRLRYSMWIYAFSGGLGWVVFVWNNWSDLFAANAATGSVDLDLPEAIAFRSVFAQVHFTLGAVLLAGAVMLYVSALLEDKTGKAAIAGALVSILAVVHPYMIVVAVAVVLAVSLARPWSGDKGSRAFDLYLSAARVTSVFGAATIPGLAYLVYLNRSNDVLREWLRITDTWSPAPWEYSLGFGLSGVLGVAGFCFIVKHRARYGRPLLIWTLVQFALLYAPVSFQRRLVEGLQMPVSIAAAVAVFWATGAVFRHGNRARARKWVLAGVIVFTSLTNLGFITGQIVGRGSGANDPRRYLNSDVVESLMWLRENAASDANLFSSYFTGNVAPSITGLRVFLGHYGQTISSDQKGDQVTAFYSNQMPDDVARQLFVEHRLNYVIYGPFEQTIARDFVPPSWLTPVHRIGDVQIFKVQLF
ncbi:MAG TPA: hypothetical protein VLM38_16465 [Blastocatellia bacterium]|nr:hypothetical protein [Blastocatellia bacterium]